MREGHKHLKLKEEHFQAVARHLKGTLEELKVPANLIAQVMAIAASTHDDVLNL
jgi:hemoglobin